MEIVCFEEELAGDLSLATELADMLAARGVPFREAHDVVGTLVARAIDAGVPLEGLTLDAMRAVVERDVAVVEETVKVNSISP